MPRLPEDPDQLRMSFGEHLDELRKRLIVSIVVLGVLFLVGWTAASDWLVAMFYGPYERVCAILLDHDPPIELPSKLKYLDFLEPVFFKLKVALIAAAVIGLPFVLYQMWLFIGAGLYPRERRAVGRFIPFSMISALAGVSFGYFFMIPEVLAFLVTIADPTRMEPNLVLSKYFSIFMLFTVALALIFQLPLVLLGLSAGGLVDAATLRKYRRHFILGAFVLSALFTPPEPYSQVLMALPTVLLFELGVILVALRERRAGAVEGGAE